MVQQKPIRGAVRLDKMQAVYAGNLASVRLNEELDNGRLVVLGSLEDDNREVYNAATPTAVDTQEVVLVHSPEVSYEETDMIVNFTNPAGKVARTYHFTVGDIITVTDLNVDGVSTKDQFLIPQNGSTKWKASASIGSTRVAGTVIGKTTIYGGQPATVFRIVKA